MVARIIANMRLRHLRAVDAKLGVEDLVAAVLGIRLREHHQLHVGRIPAELAEGRDQVIDFLARQRQSPFALAARAPRGRSALS
jgi:hypothetical protein